MNIKINFIGVLLFVLAIVVFAGALNDLKYYEFEYFNLQELCLSVIFVSLTWLLGWLMIELIAVHEALCKKE